MSRCRRRGRGYVEPLVHHLGEIPLQPGSVTHVEVRHDPDCGIFGGAPSRPPRPPRSRRTRAVTVGARGATALDPNELWSAEELGSHLATWLSYWHISPNGAQLRGRAAAFQARETL